MTWAHSFNADYLLGLCFKIFPPTSRSMVLTNQIVCSRSSLEPQSFSSSVALWGLCCVLLPCIGGRTAEHAVGIVGLSHMGSQPCLADQGNTDGHADGSDHSIIGRWWSSSGAADVVSGCLIKDCITTLLLWLYISLVRWSAVLGCPVILGQKWKRQYVHCGLARTLVCNQSH